MNLSDAVDHRLAIRESEEIQRVTAKTNELKLADSMTFRSGTSSAADMYSGQSSTISRGFIGRVER